MKTEVIRRNLQYPPDWPQSKAIEKGIDVIAVAMIRLAMLGAMDAAILFSSGKDLLPAIEVLWDSPRSRSRSPAGRAHAAYGSTGRRDPGATT